MIQGLENWIGTREAARYASVSVSKMQVLLPRIPGARKIPGRNGGEWRVKPSMIDDYLDAQSKQPGRER